MRDGMVHVFSRSTRLGPPQLRWGVVKGYAQIFCIDFSNTFSHVARLQITILILAIDAEKGCKLF